MASCAGVECADHASCSVVDGTFVCLCTPPFTGDGFNLCTYEGLPDKSLFTILVVVLLFVGLLVVIIGFVCKKKLIDKSSTQPLVGGAASGELAPYEMKWQMTEPGVKLSGTAEGPPPYDLLDEEKKEAPAAEDEMDVYQSVEEGRVEVTVDEVDEVDNGVMEIDNPAYSSLGEVLGDGGKQEVIVEDYEPEAEPEVAEPEVEPEPEPEPEVEGIVNAAVEVEVAEPVVEPPKADSTISVAFLEGPEPHIVTTQIITPEANLTINLNIQVPDV